MGRLTLEIGAPDRQMNILLTPGAGQTTRVGDPMSIIAQRVEPTNFARINSPPRFATSDTPGVLANQPYATKTNPFLDVTLSDNTEAPSLDPETPTITLSDTLTFSEVDPSISTVASVLEDIPLFGINMRLLQAVQASSQTWRMRMETEPILREDQLNVYGTRGITNPYGESPASENDPIVSPWGSWGRKSSPRTNTFSRSADLSYGSFLSPMRLSANVVTTSRTRAAEARQAAQANEHMTRLYQPSSQSAYANSRTNSENSDARAASSSGS